MPLESHQDAAGSGRVGLRCFQRIFHGVRHRVRRAKNTNSPAQKPISQRKAAPSASGSQSLRTWILRASPPPLRTASRTDIQPRSIGSKPATTTLKRRVSTDSRSKVVRFPTTSKRHRSWRSRQSIKAIRLRENGFFLRADGSGRGEGSLSEGVFPAFRNPPRSRNFPLPNRQRQKKSPQDDWEPMVTTAVNRQGQSRNTSPAPTASHSQNISCRRSCAGGTSVLRTCPC